MGGKVCFRYKGKTLLGIVKKLFFDNTQQCFALLPQANFPTNNLNFHWRWRCRDWIQAIFLNIFYFTPYWVQQILSMGHVVFSRVFPNTCLDSRFIMVKSYSYLWIVWHSSFWSASDTDFVLCAWIEILAEEFQSTSLIW